MMPAQSRVEAGIWSVPGHSILIEYSRPVLNEIVTSVIEAFDTYLAGGYEVGGVLFGQRDGNTVRIHAFRPLEITPPRPSFVLSAGDGEKLLKLIKSASSDLDLRNLIPVGWYHSHTRSEIFLSESDLEIYDRYFPEPWQIALVLHPSDLEPVRAGFFFRESDGFVRPDQSYMEFAVDIPQRSVGSRKPPPWEIRPDGQIIEDFLVDDVEPETYALPPEPEPVNWFQRLRAVAWGLLLLFAIGAGVWSVKWMRQPAPRLGLNLTPNGRDLIIGWDPASKALIDAKEGFLFVLDGTNRVDVPVNPKLLRSSNYVYRPQTGRVDVRLKVKLGWGRSAQEIASFLAHPDLGKPTPELLDAWKVQKESQAELDDVKEQFAAKIGENERIQQQIAEVLKKQEDVTAARLEIARRRTLASSNSAKPAAPKELPAPPELALRQPVQSPAIPQSDLRLRPPADPPKAPVLTPTPSAARPPVATPSPTPMPAVVKPAVVTPAAGRILWVGTLPKDGTLTIEGKKASTGFLNGEFPGSPVTVGAFPAELTNDGIKILTGNPKYAGTPRVETPSAANGWQKTQYSYDPKSTRDLIVEQLPGPKDYRKIVLRAGGRRVSVIVIEWMVAAQ